MTIYNGVDANTLPSTSPAFEDMPTIKENANSSDIDIDNTDNGLNTKAPNISNSPTVDQDADVDTPIPEETVLVSDTTEQETIGRVPLSSTIFVRAIDSHGYMVNNDYSNLQGSGYTENYVATSSGITYDNVISVCSYTPFAIVYNLEGKYSNLSGYICFDDICPLGGGFGTQFQGEAEVTFCATNDDEGSYEEVIVPLAITDFPKPFSLNVAGYNKLTVSVSFPYYNAVFDNFNKYFNIIDAYLD